MRIFRLWKIMFTYERGPQETFIYSKSTLETLKKVRTTLGIFQLFSSVSAADFEQVNVFWVPPF